MKETARPTAHPLNVAYDKYIKGKTSTPSKKQEQDDPHPVEPNTLSSRSIPKNCKNALKSIQSLGKENATRDQKHEARRSALSPLARSMEDTPCPSANSENDSFDISTSSSWGSGPSTRRSSFPGEYLSPYQKSRDSLLEERKRQYSFDPQPNSGKRQRTSSFSGSVWSSDAQNGSCDSLGRKVNGVQILSDLSEHLKRRPAYDLGPANSQVPGLPTIEQFLASLPLSLGHLSSHFRAVGITTSTELLALSEQTKIGKVAREIILNRVDQLSRKLGEGGLSEAVRVWLDIGLDNLSVMNSEGLKILARVTPP